MSCLSSSVGRAPDWNSGGSSSEAAQWVFLSHWMSALASCTNVRIMLIGMCQSVLVAGHGVTQHEREVC